MLFEVTDPDERKHTMTEEKGKAQGSRMRSGSAVDY
jgi:hypothetical protein